MAITINGAGTITGISTGGLPDGSVDADTLASGARGKVLQVILDQYTISGSAIATNSTSWTSSGKSVTITPISSTSKIMLYAFNSMTIAETSNRAIHTQWQEGSTAIPNTTYGAYNRNQSGTSFNDMTTTAIIDSSGTSARTFTLYYKSSNSDSNAYLVHDGSYMMWYAMEIAQ